MASLRVGVVGMGLMGTLYARILRDLPEVELVGVADVRLEAIAPWRGAGVPAFERGEELVDTGIDLLAVCTPEGDHVNVVLQALKAGAHVAVEKPLAATYADAATLTQAAQEFGRHLMTAYILRFDPRVCTVADAIAHGDLGHPVYVRSRRCSASPRRHMLRERTNVAMFLAVHDLDILRCLTGLCPVEVSAHAGPILGDTGAVDYVIASGRADGGQSFLLEVSWLLPDAHPGGLEAEVIVQGSDGEARIDLSHDAVRLARREQSYTLDAHQWPELYGSPAGDLRAELAYFVDVARGKTPPIVPPEAAAYDVAVCEAMIRSAAEGRPVRVDEITGVGLPTSLGHG